MNRKIIFVLIVAFFSRIFAVYFLERHINPEVWENDYIALNIINGGGHVFQRFNTTYYSGYPGYTAICAIFHFLTGQNYFFLLLFQIVLAVIVCYIVYRMAEKIFSEKVGFVASFVVAIHPGLIVYSTKIHEQTLTVFFITIIFWLILYLDKTKMFNNVIMGALIGFGMLIRPEIVLFLPVYFIYLWLSSKDFKNITKPICVMFFCAIFVILPWEIRNYKIHKKWIFITTSSAEHFWRGNNKYSSGSALTPDGKSVIAVAPKAFMEKLYTMNEIQQYSFFYKETFKDIKSNPGHFAKMILEKFFYFWWFSPTAGLWYPKMWLVVYKIFYSVMFLFFFVGLYFSLLRSKDVVKVSVIILLLFLMFFSISHSLYYVETRHRWLVEPLMIIISSYGYTMFLKELRRRLSVI